MNKEVQDAKEQVEMANQEVQTSIDFFKSALTQDVQNIGAILKTFEQPVRFAIRNPSTAVAVLTMGYIIINQVITARRQKHILHLEKTEKISSKIA